MHGQCDADAPDEEMVSTTHRYSRDRQPDLKELEAQILNFHPYFSANHLFTRPSLKAFSECGEWAEHLVGVALLYEDPTEKFQRRFDLSQAASQLS